MVDFFKFEEKEFDFPFYNGIPELSIVDWIILLLVPVSAMFFMLGFGNIIPVLNSISHELLSCIVPLILLAYVSKGKLGLIFKKPKLSDAKLIIICFFIYMVYSLAMGYVLDALGMQLVPNPITEQSLSLLDVLYVFIQLLGEELIKVGIFILGLSLLYHFTKERKGAFIFGVILCAVIFALIHMPTYDYNIAHCILIIGIGCIIHLYPYLKTKNIMTTYILHVLIDMVAIGLTFSV